MSRATPLFLVSLLLLTYDSNALRCFTCDSVASDGLCANSPGTIAGGSGVCAEENDQFCYTSRMTKSSTLKVTVNRNCCSLSVGSVVCPLGNYDDNQQRTVEGDGYSIEVTLCSEDMCNDDVDEEDAVNIADSSLIVDGRNDVSSGTFHAARGAAVVASLLIAISAAFGSF